MRLYQKIIVNGLVIAGLAGLINYDSQNYRGTASADVGAKANAVVYLNENSRSYKGTATAGVGVKAIAANNISKED